MVKKAKTNTSFKHDPKSSDVKNQILKRLWSGDWVSSKELLRLTGQKYFDRRIRELRDEQGWVIETRSHYGEAAYRLVSQDKGRANPRNYLNGKQKNEVLQRDNFTCQLCGYKGKSADSFLQIDHKVPLIRGGALDLLNLQVLCRTCNVTKRGVCRTCTLPSCDKCPFAFPEKVGRIVPLPIGKQYYEKLTKMAVENDSDIVNYLVGILIKHVGSKDRD